MKKFVKVLSALLALLMMLGCIAGCTPAAPSNTTNATEDPNQPSTGLTDRDYKDVKLQFAWWGGDARHNNTMAAVKEFDKMFKNLETGFTYSGWGEFFPTIIDIGIAGNTAPDVYQMTYEKLKTYVDAGKILKLDSYIASGAIDTKNISDNELQLGACNDGIYAIATGVNCPVYAYSTADATAAGVTLSRTPTLDELVAAAKKVYAATGKKAIIEFAEYVRMKGESYYNADGTAVAFTAQTLADWWAFEQNAIQEGWMPAPSDGIDGGKSGLVDGKVWCFTTYSNQVVGCETDSGLDLEWMAVPATDKNGATTYTQPNTLWVVSAQSKNPELAVALVNFLTNNQIFFDKCGIDRGIPISSAIRDYLEPNLTDAEKLQNTIINELTTAGVIGPRPNASAKDGEAKTELTDYMQMNQYGQIPAADMLTTAQEAIDAMNSVLG